MTLTPRPFFWSVITHGGKELTAGVGAPSHPLPREHEQIRFDGELYTVSQVCWVIGERGGPMTCSVLVRPTCAMYQTEVMR